MKILRVVFDNVLIFNDPFDIDFTAPDKITEDSGVHKVWGSINTLQTISIIGINAVGKTTSLKLLQLAMETVINNKGLNEGLIPSVFITDTTTNEGIMMTVYFYKNDFVYKLESKIKSKKNASNVVEFYYEEETLKRKTKSKITKKGNVFDFSQDTEFKMIVRSKLEKELLQFLKEDDSIAIRATRHPNTTITTMLNAPSQNTEEIKGSVDKKILNVFDDNLEKLEKVEGENRINVEFKNSKSRLATEFSNLSEIISSGTIKGQSIINNSMIALRTGGYLLIDELENHLNKELVKMIVNIFNNNEINKKGACLLFTTHYAEILDSFDRKDNIYVLTRDKNHFSKINRYTDMVSRNELKKSEVILSNYINGTAPKAISIKALEKYICENT